MQSALCDRRRSRALDRNRLGPNGYLKTKPAPPASMSPTRPPATAAMRIESFFMELPPVGPPQRRQSAVCGSARARNIGQVRDSRDVLLIPLSARILGCRELEKTY